MAIQKQCIDQTDDLMSRVILILDQARANVVRAVNSNMVIAYWLVGREIVLEMQQGERRAGYRETLLRNLSEGLTARYGKGFSNSNLKYFRQFYRVYADRVPAIGHLSSGQFDTSVLVSARLATSHVANWSSRVGWIQQHQERVFLVTSLLRLIAKSRLGFQLR